MSSHLVIEMNLMTGRARFIEVMSFDMLALRFHLEVHSLVQLNLTNAVKAEPRGLKTMYQTPSGEATCSFLIGIRWFFTPSNFKTSRSLLAARLVAAVVQSCSLYPISFPLGKWCVLII